jgi:hypothetical protein
MAKNSKSTCACGDVCALGNPGEQRERAAGDSSQRCNCGPACQCGSDCNCGR